MTEDIYTLLDTVIPNDAYVVSDVDADIDIAGPKYWRVVAPADKDLEILVGLRCLTAAVIEVFKDPTSTGAGTELTPQSMNQNASLSPEATFTYDATVSDDGDLVYTENALAAEWSQLPKLVLDRGATYQVKVTSVADNNSASLRLVCREKDR